MQRATFVLRSEPELGKRKSENVKDRQRGQFPRTASERVLRKPFHDASKGRKLRTNRPETDSFCVHEVVFVAAARKRRPKKRI